MNQKTEMLFLGDPLSIARDSFIVGLISTTIAAVFAFFKSITSKIDKAEVEKHHQQFQAEIERTHIDSAVIKKQLVDLELKIRENVTRAELKAELAEYRSQLINEITDIKLQLRELNRSLLNK